MQIEECGLAGRPVSREQGVGIGSVSGDLTYYALVEE